MAEAVPGDAYASPVVVSVAPKQPSYFAGELFECTVTFTNTRAPPTEDRAASVDVARRSASYATPDEAAVPLDVDDTPTTLPSRQGLVGVEGDAPAAQLGLGAPPRTRHRHRFSSRTETWQPGLMLSPGSPNAARSALPPPGRRRGPAIGASHPHARQKSVVQYQSEDLSHAFQLSERVRGTAEAVAQARAAADVAPSPNPDASFDEGSAERMEDALRESVNTWSQTQRHVAGQARWSHGSKPAQSPLFPEPNALPPGHERVLWSFAQLGGTFEIDRSLVRPGDFDRLRWRLASGELVATLQGDTVPSPVPPGSTPRLVGGGDMGYDQEVEGGRLAIDTGLPSSELGEREERSPLSAIAALMLRYPLAVLYAARPASPAPAARTQHIPRHMRSGSTLADIQQRALQSRTLPTFSTPPSILDVDITLAPGESRSYSFAIRLPADLPPTFHGRSVRFDYYLSIGTNRLERTAASGAPVQQSRLLHVPVRVYNHIVPGAGAVSCFDLLNPIVVPHEEAHVQRGVPQPSADMEDAPLRPDTPARVAQMALTLAQGGALSAAHDEEADHVPTCMDTVLALTRNAPKATYDIAKDGQLAAVLTLARSRYRLGDTVQAILRVNQAEALVRVVRVSAVLESHEEIDGTLALLPHARAEKLTRQVHAVHHESTLDTEQTTLSLTIPSGATPEFATSGIRHRWSLRVSLLTETTSGSRRRDDGSVQTALYPPVPHLVRVPDEYEAYYTCYQGVPSLCGPVPGAESGTERSTRLEIVECAVPVSVFPNSSKSQPMRVDLYA